MWESHDHNRLDTSAHVLAGGGEMGTRMRAQDWSQTPLGPVDHWPQSLKTAVRIMLTSRQAMFVWWGDDLINLYNDAYKSIVGGKHPQALGQPATVVWREIWDQVGPRAETAMRRNEGTYDEALLLIMERNGYPEETYYTFSYSPVPNDQGGTGGIICANTDDTQRIVGERQLMLLQTLAARAADARTLQDACARSAQAIEEDRLDLPFAMIYLVDPEGRSATLAGLSGIQAAHPAVQQVIALDDGGPWPLAEVLETHQTRVVNDLERRFGALPRGAWDRSPQQAAIVPINASGPTGRSGILIAGLSPLRLFNDSYQGFVELVAAQIAASLGNAHAYEEERQRAEALAELDRAKTTFFSNISHEFRTPLTLMLGPAEDMLIDSDTIPINRDRITIIHRNALRLLKLVNTLLDFSRIEAGRIQATYEPTDLAAFTAELASLFRSAIERAGMRLVVDCQPLSRPIEIDREMWEKIVFNLLSNAFKFTFAGEIGVTIREQGDRVTLAVRDTGTGIPPEELPHLFERFHRVSGARGRTFEGTGIGLALVQELARLMGGAVTVESQLDRGSTFMVTIPLSANHALVDQPVSERRLATTALRGETYVEEMLRWLPNVARTQIDVGTAAFESVSLDQVAGSDDHTPPAHVLLADDNADMREYVYRLLSTQYSVEAVADGAAALAAAHRRLPDLVLTDVMMPRLDGFGLLHALRADPRTAEIPVIMLSARAGEEASLEGLQAGADDYLVKPFSARELLARVSARIDLDRLRRESTRALRRSDAEFRQLAASVPELIWTAATSGEVIFTNEQWREYTGMEPETLLGWSWQHLIHPDDLPHTLAVWKAHLESGEPGEIKHRLRHRSGEWRWQIVRALPIRDDERVLKWVGSSTDIHQQEQSGRDAQFLADLAEQIRLADGAATLALNVVHTLGSYLGVTRCHFSEVFERDDHVTVTQDYHVDMPSLAGAHRLSDFPAAILDMMRAGQVVVIEDAATDPRTAAAYQHVYVPIGICAQIVVPFLRKGAWVANLMVSADTSRHWQPREIRLLELVAERTWLAIEKLRAEESLRANEERLKALYIQEQAAREQAEAASQLKDEFLATLSHELRTPLTAILGYGALLQSRKRDEAYIARSLEKIMRSAKMQAQLIDDLLDVSRIVTGKLHLEPRRLDMVAVIHAAIDAVRPALDAKDIQLATDFGTASRSVVGDPDRLQQVMWNLLSNAVKFTPSGGAIRIVMEAIDDSVQISVSDTGQGIAGEFLPFVFDRFRQAEASSSRTYGGLGLGLSIVRHLVEMHGGTVTAHSPGTGGGATFVVRLPVAPPDESATIEASFGNADLDPICPPELNGLRVLIVDDQHDILELLHDVLAPCGTLIQLCETADAALAAIRSWRPDVLVSDIAMPGQDGFWLLRNLRMLPREQGGAIPAVALTAYVRGEDRARVLASGFQMYVSKPVEPDELIGVIAHVARARSGG